MVSKEVEKLLLKVQKPGRYVGGELNEVIKDKEKVDCRRDDKTQYSALCA